MERCDFSSVMAIVRRYISEDHGLNQMDLLYELFASFLNDDGAQDFDLDNGLVCKWLSGQARLSPRISAYYQEPRHKEQLVQDIAERILPLMYDIGMAAQELSELVSLDSSISEREKEKLLRSYPVQKESDDAQLMADILCFAMERSFVKRDAKVQKLLTTGSLSPVLQDYVLDGSLPKPCRTFCGREQELSELQALLEKQDKVFLYGIAGIGKSELAKAYAWQHRRDYTNILHLLYPGSLRQMIVEMEFTDDLPNEDDAERFRRHNRFLRSLKEDIVTLFAVCLRESVAADFPQTQGWNELFHPCCRYVRVRGVWFAFYQDENGILRFAVHPRRRKKVWRSTIWKRKSSAGARAVPQWRQLPTKAAGRFTTTTTASPTTTRKKAVSCILRSSCQTRPQQNGPIGKRSGTPWRKRRKQRTAALPVS